MTIIPYVKSGCLQSNSTYHFHNFKDAVMYAYDEMLVKARGFEEPIITRFRILDTEEDFEVQYMLGWSEFNPVVKFYIG